MRKQSVKRIKFHSFESVHSGKDWFSRSVIEFSLVFVRQLCVIRRSSVSFLICNSKTNEIRWNNRRSCRPAKEQPKLNKGKFFSMPFCSSSVARLLSPFLWMEFNRVVSVDCHAVTSVYFVFACDADGFSVDIDDWCCDAQRFRPNQSFLTLNFFLSQIE